MPASVTVGVPKPIVRYCQRSSLRDSVENLLAALERLGLPPHESFLRWKRSRAVAAAAAKRLPPAGAADATTLLAWAAEGAAASSTAAILGAVAALLVAHAVAFSCLARLWRCT